MTITDEMVEKAYEAYDYKEGRSFRDALRGALEAVAPMLIAQGMREAFAIAIDHEDLNAILERAQELDPK